MNLRSRIWPFLVAITFFLIPGIPFIFNSGVDGIVNYPRFIPAILDARYKLYYLNSDIKYVCGNGAKPCAGRVSASEFYRTFQRQKFRTRPNFACHFRSRFELECGSPINIRKFYYIDGAICASRGDGVIPDLACMPIRMIEGSYFICENTFHSDETIHCDLVEFKKYEGYYNDY